MKQFIFLCLFIFITAAGYSQVLFGAKGGLNLATVTGNDLHNVSLHPSFHVGGFVNFLVTDKITVQPELLFSGKGVKSDEGTFNFGYIDIPVLAQYNSQGFFVEAGPQVGFLVSAKQKVNGNNVDFKGNMKSTDLSWLLGIGYKTLSGFGVGARYDFGFYNIANQGIIRNKAIMISLFYTFNAATDQ